MESQSLKSQNLNGHSPEQHTLVDSALSRIFGLSLHRSLPTSTMLWVCDSISDKTCLYLKKNLTKDLISTYINSFETNDFGISLFFNTFLLFYWTLVDCFMLNKTRQAQYS